MYKMPQNDYHNMFIVFLIKKYCFLLKIPLISWFAEVYQIVVNMCVSNKYICISILRLKSEDFKIM